MNRDTYRVAPDEAIANQIANLEKGKRHGYRVIHRKLEQAHKILGIINERFDGVEETFKAMSRVKMNAGQLNECPTSVYPDSAEPGKMELVKRDRSWSEYFFDQGKGNRLPGIAGSLWAAFNG